MGTLDGMTLIQTGVGGEGYRPINSLKNEQRVDATTYRSP